MKFVVLLVFLLFSYKLNLVHGKKFYLTSNGVCSRCSSSHSLTLYDYAWCHVGDSWDYCSARAGRTTRNEKCRRDHNCGYHGYSYLWCYKEDGGWDYCSKIEESTITEYGHLGGECQDYCDLVGNSYECRNKEGNVEYCSPVFGLSNKGAGCKSINGGNTETCGYHNYDYQWCYSNDNSWHYCSKPRQEVLQNIDYSGLCMGDGIMPSFDMSFQVYNDGSHRVTGLFFGNGTEVTSATAKDLADAQEVIFLWHYYQSLDRSAQNGLELRKGAVETNSGRFEIYSLSRGNRKNSPVAKVYIPKTLTGFTKKAYSRTLVRALQISLNSAKPVWVTQELKPSSNIGNLKCPVKADSSPTNFNSTSCKNILTEYSSQNAPQRQKRASHADMRDRNCNQVSRLVEAQYEAGGTFFFINLLDGPHPDVNPIYFVGYKNVRQIGEVPENIEVVTHVKAVIDWRMIVDEPPRLDFGNEFNERMRRLGARRYPEHTPQNPVNDEKGHLIASQLRGPIQWYNMAPQTPSLNRNVGDRSGWINVENMVRRLIGGGCGRAVLMQVFPNYRNLNSVRPKGFKVCLLFMTYDQMRNADPQFAGWSHYFENDEPDNPNDDPL